MINKKYHESVMVREVVENLHINNQAKYIDATLGTGGHSLEIIKAGGEVLGIEADPAMLAVASKRFEIEIGDRESYRLVNGNFSGIDKIARDNDFNEVAGIILDLGISNIHFLDDDRGFGFGQMESELDMRINPQTQGVKALDLLNALRGDQLTDLFKVTMEGGSARWLSTRIIEGRPIKTVGDFNHIAYGIKHKPGLNPLTLPFLALRIAVNNELDNLETVLPKAFKLLRTGGRLLVISFHSGEDRIVKKFRQNLLAGSQDKLVLPSSEEVEKNPRSRSAKLRVFVKL